MTHTMMIRFSLYGSLALSTVLSSSPAVGGAQPQRSKAVTAHAPANASRKIDVCQLLTSAEIAATQGESVTRTTPTLQNNGAMTMSQCLFQTATPAKSVNLLVVTRNPATKGATPREYWRQQFEQAEHERAEQAEQEREKKSAPSPATRSKANEDKEMSAPRRIPGLGDEAYWVGNSMTGALYVLHGDMFLRVSIGGGGPEATRIKNAEALARIVLKRL